MLHYVKFISSLPSVRPAGRLLSEREKNLRLVRAADPRSSISGTGAGAAAPADSKISPIMGLLVGGGSGFVCELRRRWLIVAMTRRADCVTRIVSMRRRRHRVYRRAAGRRFVAADNGARNKTLPNSRQQASQPNERVNERTEAPEV